MASPPTPREPAVAVCIPTFNQAAFVESAIRSALGQDYPGPLEVWVADDASTDATPQLLDRLTREQPELRRISLPRNVGMAASSSVVMQRPEADLIVRLDSDDLLEPSFVSHLVHMMVEHPDAGYGHTAITEIDEHGRQRRVRRVARPTGFQPGEKALRAALRGYRTAANILIFRKHVLDHLGYYDTDAEYVEDYDLSIRMADAGYGNVYVDEPLARYRVWTDSGRGRDRRKAAQLRGYRHIFDEAIAPAWARRGWSQRQVRRRRRKLAARHCPACFGPQYSGPERRELLVLLRQLGDGPLLRARLWLCRLGLARTLEGLDSIPSRLKAPVKAGMSALRRSGGKRSAAQRSI